MIRFEGQVVIIINRVCFIVNDVGRHDFVLYEH